VAPALTLAIAHVSPSSKGKLKGMDLYPKNLKKTKKFRVFRIRFTRKIIILALKNITAAITMGEVKKNVVLRSNYNTWQINKHQVSESTN